MRMLAGLFGRQGPPAVRDFTDRQAEKDLPEKKIVMKENIGARPLEKAEKEKMGFWKKIRAWAPKITVEWVNVSRFLSFKLTHTKDDNEPVMMKAVGSEGWISNIMAKGGEQAVKTKAFLGRCNAMGTELVKRMAQTIGEKSMDILKGMSVHRDNAAVWGKVRQEDLGLDRI